MLDDLLILYGETETALVDIGARLGLALLFGMIIGLDREIRGKPAGLRTHMLVALASAAFALVAIEMVETIGADSPSVRADPTRVIEAVVAGGAFLGAGAIIQSRGSVLGITTGASIWLVGALGLACGGGYYAIAVVTLILAFATLTVISYIEGKMHRHLTGRHADEPDRDQRRDG
jgi:putative Mg2+ transporter-C (MgtC) family protein